MNNYKKKIFLVILSLTISLWVSSGLMAHQDRSSDAGSQKAKGIKHSKNKKSVDFGPNVIIFDQNSTSEEIQETVDEIFEIQEENQFGLERYAVMFKPGDYEVEMSLGYYTSVIGLGKTPDDVVITGSVRVEADWFDGNATQNFWRSVENFSIIPTVSSYPDQPEGSENWAVSQAAPFRRMHIRGGLSLWDPTGHGHDWGSGGYIADSVIDGEVLSASQQQWYTRNSRIGSWNGANWNMFYQGVENAPVDSYPSPAVTTIETTDIIREKPFLYIDEKGKYFVRVPELTRDSSGITWENGLTPGESIKIEDFHIVRENDKKSIRKINKALEKGKHLLFTPGVYHLDETIKIKRPNTVVLGMGLATLIPDNGIVAMKVADVDGVIIAGLLFDAGTETSPVLLKVGPNNAKKSHKENPTTLIDLFFRVGGTGAGTIGTADKCIKINSNDVIGDHFWIWRADHGPEDFNDPSVGWYANTSKNGIVVKGDDVTIYGLFCEHFQEYQTLWKGNGGKVYFYQCELPYDPPSQGEWMAGDTNGWAAYKVDDSVTSHEAWGLGVYSFFRDDHTIKLESAIEVPDTEGVAIHHVVTVEYLIGAVGNPDETAEISHIVNQAGNATTPSTLQRLADYPEIPVITTPSTGGYIFSSTGADDIIPEVSDWNSGSTLTEIFDDPDYGRVYEVSPGMGWGGLTSCIGLAGLDDYQLSCETISFKIKAADLSAIVIKVPEVEAAYNFADAVDLGNGWYEVTVPLSDFTGTVPGATTFGIHSGWGNGGTFYITDILLTLKP